MHQIIYNTFPISLFPHEIEDRVNKTVCNSGDGYGGGRVNFLTETIFDSYEDAEAYLNSIDKDFYDGYAVKYYDCSNVKPTAKSLEYEQKIRETTEKKNEFQKEHSIKTQKTAYIGCKNCGSKLSRELLRSETCPLCHTDLRSPTVLERIKAFDDRIKGYHSKIREENKKNKGKASVMWLVKYEYHC